MLSVQKLKILFVQGRDEGSVDGDDETVLANNSKSNKSDCNEEVEENLFE